MQLRATENTAVLYASHYEFCQISSLHILLYLKFYNFKLFVVVSICRVILQKLLG